MWPTDATAMGPQQVVVHVQPLNFHVELSLQSCPMLYIPLG